MTSFDTLQSISSRLNELTTQLSNSKLSKHELEEFETLSRKLYERALILNYKAKEEKVFGDSTDKKVKPILPFTNEEETAEEKEVIAENYMEAIVEQHEMVEEEAVETRDASSSEKEIKMEDGRVQFDFSSGFDATGTEEITTNKNTSNVESLVKEESDNNNASDEIENKDTLTSNGEEEKSLLSDVKNENFEDSIAQKEEIVIEKEEKSGTSLNEVLRGSGDKTASFYARFSKTNKEARGDKLGTSKISTLKGAIGLNDRLQFVSELFQGDTEAYNQAIDQLDQLESNEIALQRLSEIAAQNSWNKDDSSVDEFAHFITRRYVD